MKLSHVHVSLSFFFKC